MFYNYSYMFQCFRTILGESYLCACIQEIPTKDFQIVIAATK